MRKLLKRMSNSMPYKYVFILTVGLCLMGVLSCGYGDDSTGSQESASVNVVTKSYGARFKVITYNTQHDYSIGKYTWAQKLTHFADEIVAVYRPAIIGLQEVQLHADCNLCSCHEVNSTQYLKTLTDEIEKATGVRYLVANALRNHDAALGVFGQCHQWEGNSVLYDPTQVNFYVYDIDKGNGFSDCKSWYQIGLQETWNDCLPLTSDNHELVSRSVFEFPKGSDHFINLYNTHLSTGDSKLAQITKMMDFVRIKATLFASENYPNLPSNRIFYPPLVIGDMNLNSNTHYADYYDEDPGSIDKIFVGIEYRFVDGGAWIVPVENSLQSFSGYSDHNVKMLELQTVELQTVDLTPSIMSILSILLL